MLKVRDLVTQFRVDDHTVYAVDGISFDVQERQLVGLVGESGSGKSVTALSILNLLAHNGRVVSGDIEWQGNSLRNRSQKEWTQILGREIGMIFQNPQASLNPVFTIGDQMIETIRLHTKCNKAEASEKAISLLRQVNLADPELRMNDYPHQLSGGMCQRVMIAMTLSMSPRLLIADEPTGALDVTIQAQIVRLLASLNESLGMSVLLISHDLGVINQFCDYVYIMYLGKIVEEGPPKLIFESPQHPYTQALLAAVPSVHSNHTYSGMVVSGEIPSPINLPTGCRFHPRCPFAMDRCTLAVPELYPVGDGKAACFLVESSN